MPVHRRARFCGLTVTTLVLAGAALSACGEDEVTSPPPTGSIEVSVAMTGSVPDLDGFLISIDDGAGSLLHGGESLAVSGLAASAHTVSVTDVAPNCTVQGEASRTVTVSANETTHVTFTVECPAFGSLEIWTGGIAGSGVPDPDGYTITIDGDSIRHIGVDDVATFSDLAARQYEVGLTGVADNCTAVDNPRVVVVTEGETTSIGFGIACPPFFDHIAFCSSRAGKTGLFVMKPDGSGLANIAPGIGCGYPAWSPDATRIAFLRPEIHVLDTSTGQITRLTDGAYAQMSSWSPDGTRIAYDNFDCIDCDTCGDIWVISADGTDPVNLTPGPALGWEPAWSPDGTQIAFIREVDDVHEVYVMQADGSNPLRLTDLRASMPGSRYRPTAFEPAWSPDGTRIAFSGPGEQADNTIWVVNADGSNVTQVTADLSGYQAWRPSWSPDGSRITYWGYRPDDGYCYQIYVIEADGSNPTNITNGNGCNTNPSWSPAQ